MRWLMFVMAILITLPVIGADSDPEYVVIATRDLRILVAEVVRLQEIAAVKGCI